MADLKAEALRIYLETLKIIDVEQAIQAKLRLDGNHLSLGGGQIDLTRYNDVALIGLGKASIRMGSAISSLLCNRITRGILVADRLSNRNVSARVTMLAGGHPTPNAHSIEAARLILDEIDRCGDQSLLIFLISGGGSALAEMPASDLVSLSDLQALNRLLVGCGASIREINIVRKFLSRIKGGKAGYRARKIRTIALYLSDVNSGDLRTIASNPLLPDEATLVDFHGILNRYQLTRRLPPSVRGMIDEVDLDVPRGWEFENGFTSILLGDNWSALQAAADAAARRGFRVEVIEDLIEDSYERVAQEMCERLAAMRSEHPGEPICLISGGEVSCPVRGQGIGGRNQHFVLYSAASLARCGLGSGAVAFSSGTDGIDGNSTAAGAAIDNAAAQQCAHKTCYPSAFLDDSDSNSFFSEAGGLLVTGPSGNNVRDIRMVLDR